MSCTRWSPSWPSRRRLDGVVFVQALLRLGGRLDVPLEQRLAERLGDLVRQHRLARAGLALDQQRPLQGDRGVDRDLKIEEAM